MEEFIYNEQQRNNIYLRCERAPMTQLLELCLNPKSGITIEGLKSIHYSRLAQLEQQYYERIEEVTWADAQNSPEKLRDFVKKMEQGIYSRAHYDAAVSAINEISGKMEDQEWERVKSMENIADIISYIDKCKDKIYSNAHLNEAVNIAERIDWNTVQYSDDADSLSEFIQKCRIGFYTDRYLSEAVARLNSINDKSIISDWNNVISQKDSDTKRDKLNAFIQKYSSSQSDTAIEYRRKSDELMKQLADAEMARRDWIDAQDKNTILDYVYFKTAHPYSEYREEAEERIRKMKGDLLSDMKRYPFRYNRDIMYSYISTNCLTMEDLVDNSGVLTDRAYSHIKRYPRLIDEQRALPLARLENPHSESGNTDVYFFGVPGSGKTCVLSGLMSLTGQLGFNFDPKGVGGGGSYAIELRNYARASMLPPATDNRYIQVMDAQINDENGHLHKLSLIEMSGEKTAEFANMDNPESFDDLGQGASGLLNNDNPKLIFFVIDPTNETAVNIGLDKIENQTWMLQSDALNCVSSLMSKHPKFMSKVVAVHIILTKSDTLGDYADRQLIETVLKEQGYLPVLQDLKAICQKYDINKQTGFNVGLYPFCVGRFMPGEVYTFDETDSLKILRVIQRNTGKIINPNKKGVVDKLIDWFNS